VTNNASALCAGPIQIWTPSITTGGGDIAPGLSLATDNLIIAMPEVPSESGIPAKALEYIKAKGLTQFVRDALEQLELAFGVRLEPTYRLFSDPESGSEMLYVEVQSSDPQDAERYLSKFNYDWWYDQLGDEGHQIGFRVVKARGV
jgi:hypothetical protein